MNKSIAVTCLGLLMVSINPIQCDGGAHGSGHGVGHTSHTGSGHTSAPASSYNAPATSYSAPGASYSAPAASYSAPATSYSAPVPSYVAPAASYSAPAASYSAPAASYSAPAASYSAPAASYGAPATSYDYPSDTSGYSSASLTGKSGAEHKMQQQFLFLLSAIADSVDPAIATIKEDLENNNFRAQSYGVALVAGGVGDSVAEYVENNRQPQEIITVPAATYQYGYNIGYGLGFGGPFLLPSYLSDATFDCSSQDILKLVSEYQYGYGVPEHVGSTELVNFGLDAKQSLHCLIKHSGDYVEAARVDYLVDDLVEAGQAVVALRG